MAPTFVEARAFAAVQGGDTGGITGTVPVSSAVRPGDVVLSMQNGRVNNQTTPGVAAMPAGWYRLAEVNPVNPSGGTTFEYQTFMAGLVPDPVPPSFSLTVNNTQGGSNAAWSWVLAIYRGVKLPPTAHEAQPNTIQRSTPHPISPQNAPGPGLQVAMLGDRYGGSLLDVAAPFTRRAHVGLPTAQPSVTIYGGNQQAAAIADRPVTAAGPTSAGNWNVSNDGQVLSYIRTGYVVLLAPKPDGNPVRMLL